MLFCALLLVTSVPQLALTYRVAAVHDSEPSQQDVDEKRVTSPSEDDVLPIDQDKAFGDLLDQRNALADQSNKLRHERRFPAPHLPVERCCCPFDTTTKKRSDGHAAFLGCKNLYAFPEGEQNGPTYWRLRASESWWQKGKWVCPGFNDDFPFSLHHVQGEADLNACARDQAAQQKRALEIDMEREALTEQMQTMDQDRKVMEQNYPCTTVAGEIVSSDGIPGFQFIGNGDQTSAYRFAGAYLNDAQCADACRKSKAGCAGITIYRKEGECFLLWGLYTPNIGSKRKRHSPDALTYRNCPTRTGKGMCANSNGVHGYEFSHVGDWEGNSLRYWAPRGVQQTPQTCAAACTKNDRCVAFGVYAVSDNCYLYFARPMPKMVQVDKDDAVAYRKCKE